MRVLIPALLAVICGSLAMWNFSFHTTQGNIVGGVMVVCVFINLITTHHALERP